MKHLLDAIVRGSIETGELEELRNLCRERDNAGAIFDDKDAFRALCSLQDINAYKALANILYHVDEARTEMARSDLVSSLVDEIHTIVLCESETDFIKLRLFFLITIDLRGSQRLVDCVNELCTFDTKRKDDMGIKGLIEVLRIVYNVTRMEKWSKEVLTGFIVDCLANDHYDIVGNAFNVLSNISPTIAMPETADITISNALRCLLQSKHHDALGYVPIACMSITRMTNNNNRLRQLLRRTILPSQFDRSQEPFDGNTIKTRLVKLLQNSNERVVLAVGGLLYSLVEERVIRMVYHLGYGNIAGFVYACNLTHPDCINVHDTSLGNSSDEEEIKKGALDNIDFVTGAPNTRPSAIIDMTEEEKEKESQMLSDLFERMERNEDFRVYTTERPNPNPNPR